MTNFGIWIRLIRNLIEYANGIIVKTLRLGVTAICPYNLEDHPVWLVKIH